jgi:ubiquitin-conjugating enzyme E2 O
LGTWNGKGTEVWTSSSSLLQLFVSIQGLILGPEPYYNEAGYEKQKGTQQGVENCRMYNENVLIKLVQSMSRMIANPPATWTLECLQHIKTHGPQMVKRYKMWLEMSESGSSSTTDAASSSENGKYK